MKTSNAFASLGLGALALFYAGCALTSKGEAISPRYFSPETPAANSAGAAPVAGPPLDLRLGQVEAASHLEERMSYRLQASEVGYYDDRRWTEEPSEYLRRALEQELFERRHLRRIVSGPASTLDVELTAFEELRDPRPHVRLALHFTLHDDRQASLERSVVVELPLAAGQDRAAEVAAALGSALTIAVARVSDAVIKQLPTAEAAPCTDTPAPSASAADPARN
jgi:cholesterol transport system auxiliary component